MINLGRHGDQRMNSRLLVAELREHGGKAEISLTPGGEVRIAAVGVAATGPSFGVAMRRWGQALMDERKCDNEMMSREMIAIERGFQLGEQANG